MKKKISVRKFALTAFCCYVFLGLFLFACMMICLKYDKFAPALAYSVLSMVTLSVGSSTIITYRLLVSAGLLAPDSPLAPLWRRQAEADAVAAQKAQLSRSEGGNG